MLNICYLRLYLFIPRASHCVPMSRESISILKGLCIFCLEHGNYAFTHTAWIQMTNRDCTRLYRLRDGFNRKWMFIAADCFFRELPQSICVFSPAQTLVSCRMSYYVQSAWFSGHLSLEATQKCLCAFVQVLWRPHAMWLLSHCFSCYNCCSFCCMIDWAFQALETTERIVSNVMWIFTIDWRLGNWHV